MAPGGETDVGSPARPALPASPRCRGADPRQRLLGGESDLFDLPTNLDGYDAIETVATQPWVSNGIVGMVGISFSGFSQIGVAATHPAPGRDRPHVVHRQPLRGGPSGRASSTTVRIHLDGRTGGQRPTGPGPGCSSVRQRAGGHRRPVPGEPEAAAADRDGNDLIRSNGLFTDIYRRRGLPGLDAPESGCRPSHPFSSTTGRPAPTSPVRLRPAGGQRPGVPEPLQRSSPQGAVTPRHDHRVLPSSSTSTSPDAPGAQAPGQPGVRSSSGTGSAVPRFPRHSVHAARGRGARVEARPWVRLLTELPSGSAEGHNPVHDGTYGSRRARFPASTEQTWVPRTAGALTSVPPPVDASGVVPPRRGRSPP